jgi:tetratricopeptide (TPR) repeat protein
LRNRFVVAVLLVLSLSSVAKEQPLAAILVYDGPAGVAYAQYTDFAINAKRELYTCSGQPLSGNEYKHQGKLLLTPGIVLTRAADGSLSLATDAKPTCVLPSNVKLEGGRTYQLKEIVDIAMISGAAVGSTNAGPTPPTAILPGMQIYVLGAPDTEFAEFLRASRANTIPVWSDYLKLYAGSTHGGTARKSLAELILAEADRNLADYRRATPRQPADFDKLRKARIAGEEANRVLPANVGSEKLRRDIDAELQRELNASHDELNAYLKAVTDHTRGYDRLAKAQAHLQNVAVADAAFPPADKVKGELLTQSELLTNTIAAAEAQIADKRFDQAYSIISRYKGFAPEVPRVDAVIAAAFAYRRDRGLKYAQESNWESAIKEFNKALEYSNDPAAAEQLKQAQEQLRQSQDTEGLQKATSDAEALAKAGQYIEAYQSLELLPERQRASVATEMEKLKRPYFDDLARRSTALLHVHMPIRTRADENGVRQALDYLERAVRLTDDDPVKIKRDSVSDKITEYYLKEALRVLQKPRGSGLGLGWLLLKEAEKFKPDHDELRNQLTKYTPDYETHAKLSIAVRFRDQTSRRENPGFADQLADTLATGLESSGIPGIKVVTQQRLSEGDSDTSAPTSLANFQILGNIITHHVDKKIDSQPQTSHYRAGHREVKNPAWIEQKRKVDALQQEFDTTKISAANAVASKQKKQIAELAAALEKTTKDLTEARRKLDALPESTLEDIIQPYNYIRRNVQLVATVEVSFRLTDPYGQTSVPADSVKSELTKGFVVLENVKADDVDGVVAESPMPDEGELLGEAETKAKGELVKKLVDQLTLVPGKVLEEARAALARGDQEGAAEKYVLYLNATAAKPSQERQEAQQFLRNEFNISTLTAQ